MCDFIIGEMRSYKSNVVDCATYIGRDAELHIKCSGLCDFNIGEMQSYKSNVVDCATLI